MDDEKNIHFKFSYLALKLLGKNLYSNAWAALSELVANGLDADATDVYVYIDMRDKRKSVIEVFDNGRGMTYEEMRDNYVYIGRNRREDQEDADTVMGRKGIGKLAALYLSRHYWISSKKNKTSQVTYEMDFSREKETSNEETPQLLNVPNKIFADNSYSKFDHGTMVSMQDVDLKGYATVSMEALNNIFSDFFSIENLQRQHIFLKIVTSDEDLDIQYLEVEKEIAFKNMVEILCFDSATYSRLSKQYSHSQFSLPYKKFPSEKFTANTVVTDASNDNLITGHDFQSPYNPDIKKAGTLKGWIGIHSSIKSKVAEENDSKFRKNKLYNPMKLRVYVRNKLAINNFLSTINNTQVFVNFIEGEISFDILDDNDFPDIATTSRQDMDENDGRIRILAENVQTEITRLIASRMDIRKKMKEKESDLSRTSDDEAKQNLKDTFDVLINKTLTQSSEESDQEFRKNSENSLQNLKSDVLQHVKGSLLKRKYMTFFSHSRTNKAITDFYYYLLRAVGVSEDEMFYTSKDTSLQVMINGKLSDISRRNITDANTTIFF
ncbi:ATP-binding protein [Lactiplantibacillus pentosus]|uniref:ATP-binding protein n=1 Tax=Lactiplantibacillus pentosus TaxID=1589 RepID=UPI002700C798|nr:ATP-binding protein [Lactiplantibacillus pentosus]MDO7806006.1 ATP-binding protein [Lactiplantibacillus pentosus]